MVKRGFGVGTLEVSFEEGFEEAIEMILRMKVNKKGEVVEVGGLIRPDAKTEAEPSQL